jgi:hypothetical protein
MRVWPATLLLSFGINASECSNRSSPKAWQLMAMVAAAKSQVPHDRPE